MSATSSFQRIPGAKYKGGTKAAVNKPMGSTLVLCHLPNMGYTENPDQLIRVSFLASQALLCLRRALAIAGVKKVLLTMPRESTQVSPFFYMAS